MFGIKAGLSVVFISGVIHLVTCNPTGAGTDCDRPGSTVTYTCQPGYTGGGTIICQANGQWTQRQPCRAITACPPPEDVPNSALTPAFGPYTTGLTVTYTCNRGWTGGGSITCQANGQWSSPLPLCSYTVRSACSDPGQIPNAGRHGGFSPFVVGRVLTYTCSSGYTGSGTIRCQSNGQWTQKPTCTRSTGSTGAGTECEDPGSIRNSGRTPNWGPYRVGIVVRYICTPGYIGGGNITCQENGEWTQRPTCTRSTAGTTGATGARAECPPPGQIPNAREVGGTGYRTGYTVAYVCHSGYTGGGYITCQSNGQWTQKPTCTRSPTGGTDCIDPDQIQNAGRSLSYPPFHPGRVVTYTCNPGYTGGGSITCLDHGQWTQRPTCRVITCPVPPDVLNAAQIPALGPYNGGSTVTYSCYPGYTLTGGETLTCDTHGHWSPSSPPACISTGKEPTPDTETQQELTDASGNDDGGIDISHILLGVFGTIIFLVLVAILVVVLFKRQAMTAWLKKKASDDVNAKKTSVHAVEDPVSFASLKEKEAKLNNDPPCYDSHYEQPKF